MIALLYSSPESGGSKNQFPRTSKKASQFPRCYKHITTEAAIWTRAVKQGEHQSRCIPKVPIVSPSLQGSIKR